VYVCMYVCMRIQHVCILNKSCTNFLYFSGIILILNEVAVCALQCMFVCMSMRMCMYMCVHACVFLCVHVFGMYQHWIIRCSTFLCMFLRVYVCKHAHTHTPRRGTQTNT
jgi:hypothetical protein